MYGFIHCALTDLIVGKFGEDVWNSIVEKAGVELGGGSYLIHKVYDDEETLRLVAATCETLDLELNAVLEVFGAYFLDYCVNSGYDRILRVLGRNLRDFLCNLDALHDHLASIYQGMMAPSFRCTEDAKSGLLFLHYYSRREGLEHIVIGLVKAIAKELLETEVQVEVVQERNAEKDHVIFAIREICTSPTSSKLGLWSFETTDGGGKHIRTLSTRYKQKQMSVLSFCKAFPFHVMFDRKLVVKQIGVALMRLIQKTPRQKLVFTDLFELTRPRMEAFSYDVVLSHVNAVFIVTTKPGVIVLPPSKSTGLERDVDSGEATLRLKGQMVYAAESENIIFLCSPRVASLDELKERGLYFSDIPLHDATRDLIFMTHARRPERELVEKLEETSNNLRKLEAKLVEDKKKTDELLHSILPKEVAAKLRLDQPVDAENYKLVTILFSDIVGFTALCSNDKVVPMDIVRMLNKLYTYFDMLSGLNDVYKVETIGDAYMVVGGLPKPCDNHAEKVANMALGMMEAAEKVLSPVDRQPLKIRIGIHSGPVMAGVVGKKMPRYCLFGNTVTLANKMESGSKPGFINVSSDTRWFLKDYDGFQFTANTEIPNPLTCFFMKAKPSVGRRPSYADIASSTVASSICIFRSPKSSPKSSPTNSPVDRRKISTEAEKIDENENVCPVRRNFSSGNFKSFHKDPSPLLDGLVTDGKREKKRRMTVAKLETANNKLSLLGKKIIGDEEKLDDTKGLTMGASFVEVDADSLSQLMNFKGKRSSVTHKEKF